MARLLYFWISLMLILISVNDIRELIIPDRYVIGIALSAVSWAWGGPAGAAGPGPAPAAPGGARAALITAALVWVFYLAALAVCAAARRPAPPFGMGDVKLLSAIALALGREAFLFTFGGASMVCGLCAAVLLLLKKKGKKDRIAFGPFISIACMVYMFAF